MIDMHTHFFLPLSTPVKHIIQVFETLQQQAKPIRSTCHSEYRAFAEKWPSCVNLSPSVRNMQFNLTHIWCYHSELFPATVRLTKSHQKSGSGQARQNVLPKRLSGCIPCQLCSIQTMAYHLVDRIAVTIRCKFAVGSAAFWDLRWQWQPAQVWKWFEKYNSYKMQLHEKLPSGAFFQCFNNWTGLPIAFCSQRNMQGLTFKALNGIGLE